MKNITIGFFLLFFVTIISTTAQEKERKFVITTSNGISSGVVSNRPWGFSTNLNLGYEIHDLIRIEAAGRYAFIPNDNQFQTSAMVTMQSSKERKFFYEPSFGIGILRSVTRSTTYLIIPGRLGIGYRINNNLAIGIDYMMPILYIKPETIHLGIFLSTKF